MRRIFIAGISGSIGQSTLSSLKHLQGLAKSSGLGKTAIKKRAAEYSLVGAALHSNWQFLLQICQEHPLESVAIADDSARQAFLQHPDKPKHILVFSQADRALSAIPCDVFVNALSGSAGLASSLLALKHAIPMLLANKESVVIGGHLMRQALTRSESRGLCFEKKQAKTAKKTATEGLGNIENQESTPRLPAVLPLDSEHAAIFSLLENKDQETINKLILTASGGPFFKRHQQNPSIEETLAHPNWKMGKKISVDSATMMNKGLEVIEAHVLFDFSYDKIDVVIHPEQAIHSLIEMKDGMCYAELGMTDMRYPIQRALTYPLRFHSSYKPFSLTSQRNLSFYECPLKQYPLFTTALNVAKMNNPAALVVMNAANQQAIELFLSRKVSFHDIPTLVEKTLAEFSFSQNSAASLDGVLALTHQTEIWLAQRYKESC